MSCMKFFEPLPQGVAARFFLTASMKSLTLANNLTKWLSYENCTDRYLEEAAPKISSRRQGAHLYLRRTGARGLGLMHHAPALRGLPAPWSSPDLRDNPMGMYVPVRVAAFKKNNAPEGTVKEFRYE